MDATEVMSRITEPAFRVVEANATRLGKTLGAFAEVEVTFPPTPAPLNKWFEVEDALDLVEVVPQITLNVTVSPLVLCTE